MVGRIFIRQTRFIIFLAMISGIICADSCFAGFGTSGWTIFSKVQSAKFQAMTTVTGVRGDLSGVFYNPAVLGTNDRREIFFLSESGFASDKLGGLVYGEPVKDGMIAAGYVYYNAGTMDLNWLDSGGDIQTRNVTSQQDMLGIVSYGRKLRDNFFGGVSVKVASSDIAETKTALAYCGDAGIFYLPTEKLSVSVALQNIGSSTKFIEDKNPLPTSGYVGSGYFLKMGSSYVLPGVGLTYNIADQEFIPEVGIELGHDFYSFNVGYRFNVDEAKLHFGVVLTWKNVDFEYAYIPGIYLDSTNRLSVGYRFGPEKTKN